MLFGRIDHIGVAVDDLDAAIELYRSRFDMREQHRETVEAQGVEAVLLEVGEGHVELLRPLSDDTAVGKFLTSRGPGLHHVAYAVDDIDATLEALRDAEVRLIDEQPRIGIQGKRIAFLHPRSTGGVLTELVEPLHWMEAFGDSPRRVDIGFAAGQSLSVRLREDAYDKLRAALASDRSERWHELHAEEAEALVDLSQVVYVRLDTQEQRVGFRGA